MCGRYALGIRATFVRHHIRNWGMNVDEDMEDDDVRETYNFAPGYRGMVYRADTPPTGAVNHHRQLGRSSQQAASESDSDSHKVGAAAVGAETPSPPAGSHEGEVDENGKANMGSKPEKYRLQAMQWGLIPFWTKRDPGFGSMIKTINCRDDSLAQQGGMWNTMKRNKRCIVLAQGFFEWQKKDGGKVKVPHFVKRKDGELMCFAGLWDCVTYEGSEDRLWTYTIITTEVNQKLAFLHDRMPVILDHGSEAMKTWLDPGRIEWTKELQSLLEPYGGELDCYPVNRDVGKVGNNSPDFIVPIDSAENKSNIANFFGNAKSKRSGSMTDTNKQHSSRTATVNGEAGENDKEERRDTTEVPHSEDNAPLPVPEPIAGKKHDREAKGTDSTNETQKKIKAEDLDSPKKTLTKPSSPIKQSSPAKSSPAALKTSGKKTRSATSNGSAAKEKPKASDGSQKITSFFGK